MFYIGRNRKHHMVNIKRWTRKLAASTSVKLYHHSWDLISLRPSTVVPGPDIAPATTGPPHWPGTSVYDLELGLGCPVKIIENSYLYNKLA